ncbi:helix-turn-helix transcriptional regulator (plasmid) [Cupriavidus sp. P-10]|uniref:helix-turn-helix domain-containing protein n=1 Tax=Cupriavidus sp. P-10 TaxID=2027911 RepID=UPI000E2E4714|nr:helix-turn-helix transcriptional regulator [Cupriavidus sp. P-10]BDB29043.1 helix-turn-helix transcriptional regulator [Cupriavidus sp. P-10]
MNEVELLVATIKRQLKAQGLTYRDVAKELALSEASVKRLFASERLNLDRLAQLAALLGFTLAELTQEAAAALPVLRGLTREQEAQLVLDRKLLLVAVCALNHWSADEIVVAYRITRAECVKRLLVLDRMGLITLLPGDRIRLRVMRDFDWLPDGPIRDFFREEGLNDFLDSPFNAPGQTMEFAHAMLTGPALEQLRLELQRLRARVALLHDESASAPLAQRRGIGMLLATREWEPSGFASLRQRPR